MVSGAGLMLVHRRGGLGQRGAELMWLTQMQREERRHRGLCPKPGHWHRADGRCGPGGGTMKGGPCPRTQAG